VALEEQSAESERHAGRAWPAGSTLVWRLGCCQLVMCARGPACLLPCCHWDPWFIIFHFSAWQATARVCCGRTLTETMAAVPKVLPRRSTGVSERRSGSATGARATASRWGASWRPGGRKTARSRACQRRACQQLLAKSGVRRLARVRKTRCPHLARR
jgi:hypothetical protein